MVSYEQWIKIYRGRTIKAATNKWVWTSVACSLTLWSGGNIRWLSYHFQLQKKLSCVSLENQCLSNNLSTGYFRLQETRPYWDEAFSSSCVSVWEPLGIEIEILNYGSISKSGYIKRDLGEAGLSSLAGRWIWCAGRALQRFTFCDSVYLVTLLAFLWFPWGGSTGCYLKWLVMDFTLLGFLGFVCWVCFFFGCYKGNAKHMRRRLLFVYLVPIFPNSSLCCSCINIGWARLYTSPHACVWFVETCLIWLLRESPLLLWKKKFQHIFAFKVFPNSFS